MNTVLIVDDDENTRTLVAEAVRALGFAWLEAVDGVHALRILSDVQPDLIILDWMMPGKDGPEVLREIRSKGNAQLVPVIMLTAREETRDKVTALEIGADDYITKPFKFQELQARIKASMRIRELNLNLAQKNKELIEMQDKLIAQEKKQLAHQLGGAAAHQLGQPLSAILLNVHLLETLDSQDPRCRKAQSAIREDAEQMKKILEKLKTAQGDKSAEYYGKTQILDMEEE